MNRKSGSVTQSGKQRWCGLPGGVVVSSPSRHNHRFLKAPEKSCRCSGRETMCSERTLSAARADLNVPISTRAPCVNRVQSGPASSRFSKHSLLITFALSAACGGVRRPAGGGMRSYMGNAKCADTVVPMALNTRPARQRSSCADANGRQHPACFALFRQKKSPNLRLYKSLFRPQPLI